MNCLVVPSGWIKDAQARSHDLLRLVKALYALYPKRDKSQILLNMLKANGLVFVEREVTCKLVS
jgi:hypothetical protein